MKQMTKQMWMTGVLTLGLLATSVVGLAQSASSAAGSAMSPYDQAVAREAAMVVRTVYLKDTEQIDMMDLQTDLRNLFGSMKIYSIPGRGTISLEGSPEQVAKAETVIAELDKPRKQYRLMYRLTDSDAGKRIGDQAFSLVVFSGKETVLKQGSRVPVLEGGSQFVYRDVGMNITASVAEYGDGVKLQTKLEESSLSEEKQGAAANDPVIRQTDLEGTAVLVPGKPIVLGSLDVPGSTRHQQVEVEVQAVP